MQCYVCGYQSASAFELVENHIARFKARKLNYKLFKCPDCTSELSDPLQGAPADWYDEYIEFYGWRWEFSEVLKDLKNLLKKDNQRLLEIGCGEGRLLKYLNEGHRTCGLDLNSVAIKRAKEKGLEAYDISIEEYIKDHPDQKFNAAIMFNVIEHLDNPMSYLNKIKQILKKNAYIFLSFPHPRRPGIIFGREHWDYPPHHLFRFSEKGIKALLDKVGFELVKLEGSPRKNLPHTNASVIANSVLRKIGIEVVKMKRHLRILLKMPMVLLLFPLGLYEYRKNFGGTMYAVGHMK